MGARSAVGAAPGAARAPRTTAVCARFVLRSERNTHERAALGEACCACGRERHLSQCALVITSSGSLRRLVKAGVTRTCFGEQHLRRLFRGVTQRRPPAPFVMRCEDVLTQGLERRQPIRARAIWMYAAVCMSRASAAMGDSAIASCAAAATATAAAAAARAAAAAFRGPLREAINQQRRCHSGVCERDRSGTSGARARTARGSTVSAACASTSNGAIGVPARVCCARSARERVFECYRCAILPQRPKMRRKRVRTRESDVRQTLYASARH